MIVGSANLRYRLALSENRMCDEPRSHMTTAEKLKLFTAHAAASPTVPLEPGVDDVARRVERAGGCLWGSSHLLWDVPWRRGARRPQSGRRHPGRSPPRSALCPRSIPASPNRRRLVVSLAARKRERAALGSLSAAWGDSKLTSAVILFTYLLVGIVRFVCAGCLSTGVNAPVGRYTFDSGCFKMWEGNSNRSFKMSSTSVWGNYVAASTRIFFTRNPSGTETQVLVIVAEGERNICGSKEASDTPWILK